MRRLAAACLTLGALAAGDAAAHELTGFLALDYRGFWEDELFTPQRHNDPSFVAQPEYFHEWNRGDDIITFTPFFRYDVNDSRRTHGDIRELYWRHVGDDWERLVGISKVFWGVTEVQHLVDIINQIDLIEDIDEEDRLGQPMVRLSWIQDWGTLTLFALPGFRERTFAGKNGRLRVDPPVEVDDAKYDSGAKWRHVDFAARYSHTFGDFDVGIANFWGTSREPRIIPRVKDNKLELRPYYDIINQTSLDAQATLDNWLLKLEAIYRSGNGPKFGAVTGGIEYSFYGVFETNIDVGIVLEGMYDNRVPREAPFNQFQRDAFLGLRLGFNDVQSTEFLGGGIYDFEDKHTTYFIEASRRVGDRWKVEFDLRLFTGLDAKDPAGPIRRDSHVQLRIARFF